MGLTCTREKIRKEGPRPSYVGKNGKDEVAGKPRSPRKGIQNLFQGDSMILEDLKESDVIWLTCQNDYSSCYVKKSL